MATAHSSANKASDTKHEAARPVVLIGLMGAGKSCVGRRLAESMALPFRDSDAEVEKAAGCTVADIFEVYGEDAFRDCERRVIQRLLGEGPSVIATGGGAFMDEGTRAQVLDAGLSVWLRADPDILFQRTKRNRARPLLENDDPLATLRALAELRYPVYAEADLTIDTDNEPIEDTVQRVLDAVRERQGAGE